MVDIEATEGVAITGLKRIRVYAPEAEDAYIPATAQKSDIVEIVNSLAGSTERVLTGAVPRVAGAAMVGKVTDKIGSVNNTNTTSTHGANSGSNSGNSGLLAGGGISQATATPTVVTQPAPAQIPAGQVVNPVVVDPVIVNPVVVDPVIVQP